MANKSLISGLLQNEDLLVGLGLLSGGSKGQGIGEAGLPALLNAAKIKKAFAKSGFRQLSNAEKKARGLPLDKQFQLDLGSNKVMQIGGTGTTVNVGDKNPTKIPLEIQKQYEKESQNFKNITQTRGNIISNTSIDFEDRTPEDDFALVYQTYKFYDPTSVVREGEFYNLQNTGGYQRKFGKIIPKFVKGRTLSKDQVENLQKTITQAYPNFYDDQANRYDRYKKIMMSSGNDPEIYLQNYLPKDFDTSSQASNKQNIKQQSPLRNIPTDELIKALELLK